MDVDVQCIAEVAVATVTGLATAPRALIVDLTAVEFMASTGFQVLLDVRAAAGPSTTVVVVANGAVTARPIEITGIDQVIPLYHYYDSADLIAEAWIAAGRSRFGDARALALTAADFARDHHQWAREVWCLQTAFQLDDTDAAERLTELAERAVRPAPTALPGERGAPGRALRRRYEPRHRHRQIRGAAHQPRTKWSSWSPRG